MKEIIIILLCIILTALIIVICYGGNYLYNLGINPKHPKDLIFKSNTDEETKQSETSGVSTIDSKTWLLKYSNYEDLFINSKDNLKLHNFLIKNENKSNKWVIAVHGYTSQGTYMASYAQNFYDMGYNIIIPDLRGHGKSEGTYIGMGWDERFDIIDLINYINDNFKDSQIVLFGVSMGAATVMMTSGESLPENVKVFVEDCGYTSTWEIFANELKLRFHLPEFPLMQTANFIASNKAGYDFKEASSLTAVSKCERPMLFIHGTADDFIPYSMMNELYEAKPGTNKQMLTAEGATHANSLYLLGESYWNNVFDFIDSYIK